MLSQPNPSQEPRTLDPPKSGLLDLSKQLRNLLLLRPLFQLEQNKLRMGEEGTPDTSLFLGVDTIPLHTTSPMRSNRGFS